MRKSVGGFENKVICIFKTNTPTQTVYGRIKQLNKSKTQKKSEEKITNTIRNLFILKEKEKHRIIADNRTIFEEDDDEYYTPKRISKFWNNNYIEYENNGDRNKHVLLEEFLIKLYLRDIRVDLQLDTWEIKLTIVINFISSKDAEEEHVMHSKSSNIKFTSDNDANEDVDELFDSLRSEKSMEIQFK